MEVKGEDVRVDNVAAVVLFVHEFALHVVKDQFAILDSDHRILLTDKESKVKHVLNRLGKAVRVHHKLEIRHLCGLAEQNATHGLHTHVCLRLFLLVGSVDYGGDLLHRSDSVLHTGTLLQRSTLLRRFEETRAVEMCVDIQSASRIEKERQRESIFSFLSTTIKL